LTERICNLDGTKKDSHDNPTFMKSEELGMAVLEIWEELTKKKADIKFKKINQIYMDNIRSL